MTGVGGQDGHVVHLPLREVTDTERRAWLDDGFTVRDAEDGHPSGARCPLCSRSRPGDTEQVQTVRPGTRKLSYPRRVIADLRKLFRRYPGQHR